MTEKGRIRKSFLGLVLEAAAIFAAVTLGFIADDYRDYRTDRRLEQESLNQVLLDLELDTADLTPILRQATRIADGMRWISNGIARGRLDSDSLLTVVDTLNQTAAYSYEVSNSAYVGLKSTGRLDLIRDAELRRALVQYYEDRQPILLIAGARWQQAYLDWGDDLAVHIEYYPNERVEESWPHVKAVDTGAIMTDRVLLNQTLAVDNWSRTIRLDIEEAFSMSEGLASEIRDYLR